MRRYLWIAALLPCLFDARLLRSQATPDDLAPMVAAMGRVGAATWPSLAPDGKQLAFLTRLSGSPQVWTVPTAGGWPMQVTAFDDPVSAVEWSPTGEWIALTVAPGGGLNTQIYLVRPNGTGLRRITEGGKENQRAQRLEPRRTPPDARLEPEGHQHGRLPLQCW